MVITIDGVAGAGKSTVSVLVAEKLGFLCLNSGSIYRALALKFSKGKFGEICNDNLKKLLSDVKIEIKFVDQKQKTYLDGKAVDNLIRTPEISMLTSKISAYLCVRNFVKNYLRKFAEKGNFVVEGRSIGTKTFVDAFLKIYLTADVKERAKRRLNDLRNAGDLKTSFEEILKLIQQRDYQDQHRKVEPLICAKDDVLIDSTKLTIKQVVDKIVKEFKHRQKDLK